MASPRERMVASAALLIRERGAHPTAIADVLALSGAPRGSAYHYFPGGRTQLLCEAVDYAAHYVASTMERSTSSLDMLDRLVQFYRRQLLETDFRAGCPVVAVAVEAGDPQTGSPIVERAGAAFSRWNDLIAQRLIGDGIPANHAANLAVLMTSAVEGAIILARAGRDITPIDVVHQQLRNLLQAEQE